MSPLANGSFGVCVVLALLGWTVGHVAGITTAAVNSVVCNIDEYSFRFSGNSVVKTHVFLFAGRLR